MKAERTPWFFYSSDPPVNASVWGDKWEWKCLYFPSIKPGIRRRKNPCAGCMWRGLTKRGLAQWKRGAR